MTVLNSLQKSVYQRLSNDVSLGAVISGVFDRAAADSIYPYITLGSIQCKDWSTVTTTGYEVGFTLHIWSREGGRKQTAVIMEIVHGLLHNTEFSVTGYKLVMLRLASSQVILEKEGWTYHGELNFQAFLEQTS